MNVFSRAPAFSLATTTGPARCVSYVVRHWRGELSLRTAFWRNWFALSLSLGYGTNSINSIEALDAPRLMMLGFALTTLAGALVAVWQLVGVWRCAGRTIAERRRRGVTWGWAGVARVVAVCGALLVARDLVTSGGPAALENLRIAVLGDPTPRHILRLLDQGREIALTGGFDFGTSADFAKLLEASPGVRTIDLNSPGGRVAEGKRAAKLIRARHLATYTGVVCASACTIAYLGGDPRYLGPGAKLGFHQYTFPGLTGAQASETNAQGERSLVRAGVDAGFAARAFATPSSGIWFPDAGTLVSAGVVTQRVDGMAFSVHAAEDLLSVKEIVAAIEQHAGFAALRRAEPEAFARLVADLRARARQDVTVRDAIAPAQEILRDAMAKYRPFADDATQVQVAALAADEGEMLSRDHPDACLKALDRTYPPWSYAGLLTPAMREREIGLDGGIIETGAAALAGRPMTSQPSEQALSAEEERVWDRVRAAGHDRSAVGRASNVAADQRARCLTEASFMRHVEALPADRAGPLMRHIGARRDWFGPAPATPPAPQPRLSRPRSRDR